MTAGTINSDATLIPDKAEVWLMLADGVTNIADHLPENPGDDLAALGWDFSGLIDEKKGIPLNPEIEKKVYNGFGHPRFRVKLKNGALETGFTALERNATTKKIVLPGSAPGKIGIPRDIQIYVLYRYVDEGTAEGQIVWATLTKAPVEIKSTSGIVEGELFSAECVVHHTADANGDVFEVIDASSDDVTKTFTIDPAVTSYTATVGGVTTSAINTKTKAALQSALRLLSTVQALPAPGVVVNGPDGGPLAAEFTGPVGTVSATGTGGTVGVA